MYEFKCLQCDHTFQVKEIEEGVIIGNNHITEKEDHISDGEEFYITKL